MLPSLRETFLESRRQGVLHPVRFSTRKTITTFPRPKPRVTIVPAALRKTISPPPPVQGLQGRPQTLICSVARQDHHEPKLLHGTAYQRTTRYRSTSFKMKKSIFSATELITALIESNDQYYTDIGRINYIIERYIRYNKGNASIWLQDAFGRTMDLYQEGNNTAENIETLLKLTIIVFILEGLHIKIEGKSYNNSDNSLDISFILDNFSQVHTSKQNLKTFFEDKQYPLPYFLFKTSQNNSKTHSEENKNKFRIAYREVFESYEFDEQLETLRKLNPTTITEFAQKRDLLKQIEQEKRNFINSEDITIQHTNFSLHDITKESIVLILETLCRDHTLIANELQARGLTRERIGQLMNFKEGGTSKDACIKRASRMLKPKKKNTK
ncbi:hypothetical protein [Solidesulfovibrio alcoholivorans]|uniref:hypothetical protein n=1 Tax=Solidesulfovibrio alcoholivorans TaxID=81406 RepID=UPI0012EC590E|nr:hypothetical protein [Solidesulfovibrio alcoholivorans]HML59361.1 hypothetical protein [Solidesulfovibrio sp.]